MPNTRRMSNAAKAKRFAIGLYKGTFQVKQRVKWLAKNTFFNRSMIAKDVSATSQSVMLWEDQDRFTIEGKGARKSFCKWISPKTELRLREMLEEPGMSQMTIAQHYRVRLTELRGFCDWRGIGSELKRLPLWPPKETKPERICSHCKKGVIKSRNVCKRCFERARVAGYITTGPRCVECGRPGYGQTGLCMPHFVRHEYRMRAEGKPHKKKRRIVFNRPCPVCSLIRSKCLLKKLVKNR